MTRQHDTLAAGAITSKSGWATLPWGGSRSAGTPIVAECLRLRGGAAGYAQYHTPFTRRRDALAYKAMMMGDARRLMPRPPLQSSR